MLACRYMFLCDKWLAVDKGDHNIRRTLNASQGFINPGTSSVVCKDLSKSIFEDHIWLTVGYRVKKSLISRAQSLGACMATLFLAMISNCMFFKDASEEKVTAPLISIGPISITGTQLYSSFMSSFIVFPPVLLIIFLFSKSSSLKGQEEKEENRNNNSNITLNKNKQIQVHWSHWCCYVGWALVFLAISVSALFTIMYNMQWGKVKSTDWLIAFILSFFESAVLIEPIKVSWRILF